MRIKNKLNQYRRDFTAIYECEHCSHEQEAPGYDDQNFHINVIPNMRCKSCGESAPTSSPRTQPDVPAHITI